MIRLNMRMLFALLVMFSFSQYRATADDNQAKRPVPDKKAQSATTDLVRSIYQDDVKNARTAGQKLAFAEMLLEDGIAATDDDTGRYVLLQMAREMAAESGDVTKTLQAIDQLEQDFEIDTLAEKSQSFVWLAAAIRTREQRRDLLSAINASMNEVIAADRYDLATKLAELALVSARKARDVAAVRKAASQVVEVEALEKDYRAVQPSLTKLDTAPADPDANLAVGKYLCFVKGDWYSGIPMLVLGNDQLLKSLAEKELAKPTQPAEQVSIADGWWKLAEAQEGRIKQNIMVRARSWYLEALPALSGLTEMKVRKRLSELDEPSHASVRLPAGTILAFDFERSSVERRDGKLVLRDLSQRGGDGEIVNGRFTLGVYGTALSFQGNGYVKFPDKALPKGDAPRSILFWGKIDKFVPDQVPFIFGSAEDGDATYTIVFQEGRSDGKPGRKLHVGNPGGRNEPAGATIFADGTWHHVALIYDGGTVRLFVDGQLDLEFGRKYATTSPGDAFIGSFVGGTGGYVGAIDDFIVLDRAISVDEIKTIKDTGLIHK